VPSFHEFDDKFDLINAIARPGGATLLY
jgi:hypothetical protein